jgi:hypothetical protein
LILGHSWARQRAISASSRSMARRAGRCTLQSSRRSRRHTCPGVEADTGELLDRRRDAAQRPQLGVEPERLRAKP